MEKVFVIIQTFLAGFQDQLNEGMRDQDRDRGATMVEYALMVALIAVVALGAVELLGGSVSGIFTEIEGKL